MQLICDKYKIIPYKKSLVANLAYKVGLARQRDRDKARGSNQEDCHPRRLEY
jgi:hypothetical protein